MNNMLPSDVTIHEKYDLKGSLYKRKASKQERAKSSPTYKDLDFLEEHPQGIKLDEKTYNEIINNLKRDCLILQSFGIMDYSLLLGIHNIDKDRALNSIQNVQLEAYYESKINDEQFNVNNLTQQSSATLNATNSASVVAGLAMAATSHKSQTLPLSQNNNKMSDIIFNV